MIPKATASKTNRQSLSRLAKPIAQMKARNCKTTEIAKRMFMNVLLYKELSVGFSKDVVLGLREQTCSGHLNRLWYSHQVKHSRRDIFQRAAFSQMTVKFPIA